MTVTSKVRFLGILPELSKGFRTGHLAAAGLVGEIDAAKRDVTNYCGRTSTPTPLYLNSLEHATQMLVQEMIDGDYDRHRSELVFVPLQGMFSQLNLIAQKNPERWNNYLNLLLITTYGDFSDFLMGYKQDHQTIEDHPRAWRQIGEPSREQISQVVNALDVVLSSLVTSPLLEKLNADNLGLIQEIRRHLWLHMPNKKTIVSLCKFTLRRSQL